MRAIVITTTLLLILNMSFMQEAVGAEKIKHAQIKLLDLPLYSQVYNDQRDPFADAKAALTLAQNTQRNVMIKVGGNWCGWCKRMDAFLQDNPEVFQALHQNFVLLKVNVSDSNENEDFMKSLPPVMGYPHIYISSADGKMLVSKDTAELYVNEAYSAVEWNQFLAQYNVLNTQG